MIALATTKLINKEDVFGLPLVAPPQFHCVNSAVHVISYTYVAV